MAGRRRKVEWFYDEVYRQNYYVYFAHKPYRLIEFAKEERGVELVCPGDGRSGAFWNAGGDTYIWIGSDAQKSPEHLASIIAHECGHAAVDALMMRGVLINPENDEAFCYYLQFLVREVTKLVPKNFVKKGGAG